MAGLSTAIDIDDLPGHERGCRRGQEHDDVRNLVRVSRPLDDLPSGGDGETLAIGKALLQFGVDDARCHAIDTNTQRAKLGSEARGKGVDSSFGASIVEVLPGPDSTGQCGRDVD